MRPAGVSAKSRWVEDPERDVPRPVAPSSGGDEPGQGRSDESGANHLAPATKGPVRDHLVPRPARAHSPAAATPSRCIRTTASSTELTVNRPRQPSAGNKDPVVPPQKMAR
jgi:hypothetical protein